VKPSPSTYWKSDVQEESRANTPKTLHHVFDTPFVFAPAVQFSSKKQPSDHDQTSSATTIKIAVALVSVNANVTDKHGNPIKDLHENEF
jgi:hypothetical protein